ncbi:hypothetical protein EDD15DRAFT_2200964 [Pisolithus albus]|nr:hypothetical protein EDD15DRAFT_2200964 [Pisolithus albus]
MPNPRPPTKPREIKQAQFFGLQDGGEWEAAKQQPPVQLAWNVADKLSVMVGKAIAEVTLGYALMTAIHDEHGTRMHSWEDVQDIQMETSPVEQWLKWPLLVPKDLPASHNDEGMATDGGVAKDKGKAKQVNVMMRRKPQREGRRNIPKQRDSEGSHKLWSSNKLTCPMWMASFIQGVEDHGLKNCYIKNAPDIGIHHNVVGMDSLMGGQSLTEAYTNNVRWLEGAPKTKAILYNGEGSNPMEYFASGTLKEQKIYQGQLANYWNTMVRNGRGRYPATPQQQCNSGRASMPAKLKALKYGLMHSLHPNGLLGQFPNPTKLFLYALSKQLNHLCEGIMVMAVWIESFSLMAVDQKQPMWQDHVCGMENLFKQKLQASSCNKSLITLSNLPMTAKDRLDMDMTLINKDFVDTKVKMFIQSMHTEMTKGGVTLAKASKQLSLPDVGISLTQTWNRSNKNSWSSFLTSCVTCQIKKPETLIKKLVPVFMSYKT